MRKYKYLALVLFAVGLFTLLFNAGSAQRAYAMNCDLYASNPKNQCLITTQDNITGNKAKGITGVTYSWVNMSTIQATFHANPPGNVSLDLTDEGAEGSYPINDGYFSNGADDAGCNGQSGIGAPENGNITSGKVVWLFELINGQGRSCSGYPMGTTDPTAPISISDPLFGGYRASKIIYTHTSGANTIGFSDTSLSGGNTQLYHQCADEPNVFENNGCSHNSCNNAIIIEPDNKAYMWPLTTNNSSNSGRSTHNYENTENPANPSPNPDIQYMGAQGCHFITYADSGGTGSSSPPNNGYSDLEREVILDYDMTQSQDKGTGQLFVYIPNLTYTKVTIPSHTNTTTTGGTGTSGTNNASCQFGGSPLTWILCPIFNGISDASTWLLGTFVKAMLTTPILTFNNSHSPASAYYVAWSNFRVYGDIILVIAILVIVYSETIGGGVLDAYTVKKMLPRILIAAILINLSIYIVAGLMDIAQVIGAGISNAITAPFQKAGIQDFHISGAGQASIISFGILGAFLGGASVGGAILAIASGAGFAVLEAAFFLILPVILGAIAIVVTLIIRQGLIILLLIISPVAFALYCLPNSEQYFKRWWKLLLETLLVYPIIMLIAGVASAVSTVTLLTANVKASQIGITHNTFSSAGISAAAGVTVIIAFFMQFLPLLAVPFAFRIAGGTLGRLNELLSNGAKQVNKLADSRREIANRKYKSATLEGRGKAYQRLKDVASNQKAGRFQRGFSRFAANRLGGYDLEHALSTQRAETKKGIEETIATGKDGEIRGLTVNKRTSQSRSKLDGTKQFRSLGGAWIDEADVDAGHARWGHDEFAQQAALAYEMRKVNTDDDSRYLASNYNQVAADWGVNEDQAAGMWKGAAFENQNQHLDYKYTNWKNGKVEGQAAEDFIQEAYNKKGSYPLAQMHAETIKTLSDLYQDKNTSADGKARIAAISETFMHDLGTQQIGATGDDGAIPITAPAPGAAAGTADRGGRITSTPGAAAVAERVRELAALTGTAPAIQLPSPTIGPPTPPIGPSDKGEAPTGEYNDKRRREQ